MFFQRIAFTFVANTLLMNTKSLRILFYLFALSLVACHPDKALNREIDIARSIVEEEPDTALCILQRISEPQKLTGKEYAMYCLVRTQAEDNNHQRHTSDTTIKVATDYFGKSNEPELAALSYFYLGRVHEDMDNDLIAERHYQTALAFIKQTGDYKRTAMIYNRLSGLYQRMHRFDEAIEMQKQAYSNQLLAENGRTDTYPLPLILLVSALMIGCLFVMYLYRIQLTKERKKISAQNALLNKTQQTASEQKIEIISLKKDISSLQKALYNSTQVVTKIRNFNEAGYSPKNKPSLTEQEWHHFLGLLDNTFGFISRLKENYPKLTDDDLRVCALLKEGVLAAHISTILNMTSEALTRRMQRIKSEKIGLGEQKASLETIIKSF